MNFNCSLYFLFEKLPNLSMEGYVIYDHLNTKRG